MAVSLEQLPDEPIIIVTIEGEVTADMMREIYAQIADILESITGTLYRITDVRKQTTTFADMMGIVKQASAGVAGSTLDPRIQNIFVGRDRFTLVGRDMYVNSGSSDKPMPVFETIEDALSVIRSGSLGDYRLLSDEPV